MTILNHARVVADGILRASRNDKARLARFGNHLEIVVGEWEGDEAQGRSIVSMRKRTGDRAEHTNGYRGSASALRLDMLQEFYRLAEGCGAETSPFDNVGGLLIQNPHY